MFSADFLQHNYETSLSWNFRTVYHQKHSKRQLFFSQLNDLKYLFRSEVDRLLDQLRSMAGSYCPKPIIIPHSDIKGRISQNPFPIMHNRRIFPISVRLIFLTSRARIYFQARMAVELCRFRSALPLGYSAVLSSGFQTWDGNNFCIQGRSMSVEI